MREVQILTGVQKKHRKVADSIDADGFVIIKEQREQTQQQGESIGRMKEHSTKRGESIKIVERAYPTAGRQDKETGKGETKSQGKRKDQRQEQRQRRQLARPGTGCRGSRGTWAVASVRATSTT